MRWGYVISSDGLMMTRLGEHLTLDKLGFSVAPGHESVLEVMANDPLVWGQAYFPRHFSLASPDFHLDIIDAACRERYLAIAAPRGSAKSTILVFLYPFHRLVFKQNRFILIVSNTFKKAAMHLESIKRELRDNEELKRTFPPIEIVKDAEGDSEFRHADGFQTKILCKGVDQIGSIRGVKFGADRPDLIIGDDMEDDELVRNPLRRRDLKDAYDEALIPAGQHGVTQIIMIGTVLHDDCQLAKLIGDEYYPEYRKIILRAHLNVGKKDESSLWPEKWSVSELNDLMQTKPSVYAKEMQNDPVSGLMQKFAREDFRYWYQEDGEYVLLDEEGRIKAKGDMLNCRAGIACDLAWEERKSDDFSVILPAFLTPGSEVLVDDYVCKRGMRPHEIEEILFSMEARLRDITRSTVYVGFEKAKLEKVIKHLLREAMKKRGQFLVFKDLAWDGDKLQRVETRLEPRYAQHILYHKHGMGELEHQLERFPSGAKDDLPDALQGVVQILQYPKSGKVRTVGFEEEDTFMKLKKLKARQANIEKFKGFGRKHKTSGIPAIWSPW